MKKILSYLIITLFSVFSLTGQSTDKTIIINGFNKVDVSCYGESTGGVCPILSGGTPPFSYLWSNGSTDSCIIYIAAGIYTLTVTDDLGFVDSDTIEITQPDTLKVFTSQLEISCYGACDGVACIDSITGGTPPYSTIWSPPNNYSLCHMGLCPERYDYMVVDDNMCINNGVEIISDLPPVILNNVTMPDQGSCNGSIHLTVSGGGTFYLFDIGAGIPSNTTGIFDNLCSGFYNAKAIDANGCEYSDTITVPLNLSIIQPRQPEVVISPNPASEKISLNFDNSYQEIYIKILDINSTVIFENYYIEAETLEIDPTYWSAGIYFIHLKVDNQYSTKKIVLTK